MKAALVKPPHLGSQGRGVGFYTDRLLTGLATIPGLETGLINFSHSPTAYLPYDLVHFPYFDLFYLTFPPFRPRKTVVTLHDVTPLKFPQHFPLGIRGKNIWPVQKRLLQTADAIITDSFCSKNDIRTITGYPEGKIYTVYLAPDANFKKVNSTSILRSIKVKYHLPEKFVLYVGGVNWNKNVPALIKACQKVDMTLVLVGKEFLDTKRDLSHPELQTLKEIVDLTDNNPRIIKLGFVPTEDLAGIYNLANVYVQPSVYEGFGLPVLEAMSCGTPVICGQNSSLGEIAGEAAVFADVTDPVDLARKILKLLKLPNPVREKISKECLNQAAKFSWQKTAREVYEIYQKVLAG